MTTTKNIDHLDCVQLQRKIRDDFTLQNKDKSLHDFAAFLVDQTRQNPRWNRFFSKAQRKVA